MNRKARGTRGEYKTMRLLEAAGYTCTRSAASLGIWDVVGIGPTDVVLVQVKVGQAWPGTSEMETFALLRVAPNVRKLVHRWRDRQRMPDVREVA